jgi:hypothetical protein
MLEGVSSSNAKLHLWEFLICINQHSVLPWSMITNSTSRGGKKAPPWQPRLLQVFKTGLMNAKDSSTWKTKYQAVITYKVYHQMATVRWLTWKLELTVNDLLPVLSLIDTQDRKQKDRCHVSNMAPPDRFRSTHSSTYSKQQVTSKNMKMTTLPLQVSRGGNGCGKPQLFLVRGKASANNVATMTVVTAEDVKLEGATEIVNGASIFIHSTETGPKEPRECIEDIVTQCNEPPAEPGPKSTSKDKINSAKFHKSNCFESGSRIVLQDNHFTLLDAIGLNWKTTLVTHYLGTLEASQHIYIQLERPNSN